MVTIPEMAGLGMIAIRSPPEGGGLRLGFGRLFDLPLCRIQVQTLSKRTVEEM